MNGKIALITGSTKGIGKSIAFKLAQAGLTVIINGTDTQTGSSVESEMKSVGHQAAFIQADVSNFEECAALSERIKKDFGKVDVLVNNAGTTKDKMFKNMTLEEWSSVLSVNLDSMFNITKNILDLIPDGGRIINMSAVAGISGNIGQTNYSAAKAGIIGFTKSLAKELGKRKITVNVVAPGLIKSEMTDKIPPQILANMLQLVALKEMGEAQDVAAAVNFLASDEARYISGVVLRVDGGIFA
jgi:3-oxoacyl-[acyl-carrier protein] reductase